VIVSYHIPYKLSRPSAGSTSSLKAISSQPSWKSNPSIPIKNGLADFEVSEIAVK